MPKRQTFKSVCDALVEFDLIKSWTSKRIDASYDDDGSQVFTAIEIVRQDIPLIDLITNETYGKRSELYLRTRKPKTLESALRVAGVQVEDVKEDRVVIHVSLFKGWHWWQ